MPYTPTSLTPTPELLLPRSDSKNPSTTCAGLTTSGRPCRRDLASPASPPRGGRRASAPPVANSLASRYCWQHKSQAPPPLSTPPPGHINSPRIQKQQRRASTDTLVAKFDALDLASQSHAPRSNNSRPRPSKQAGFWESLCCMTSPGEEEDYVEVVRHKRRTSNHPSTAIQPGPQPPMTQNLSSHHLSPIPPAIMRPPAHRFPASAPAAPTTVSTQNFMRYIPPNLDPRTTANLLTELSKPISAGDEEGYIYIFWLTPESRKELKPSDDDAESLLLPPTASRPRSERSVSARKDDLLRANSVLRRPASIAGAANDTDGGKRTILLKIGRANNVHRRMAEWTRQCGYDLSLVRFYPYIPSSQLNASSSSAHGRPSLSPRLNDRVRKVPYVHRVERLIHLELAGRRKDQGKCAACGREHREWFEVEASRQGVRSVDALVRRWVSWAETEAQKQE